jgi:hypothetical protein
MTHYEQTLSHLLRMARNPAFKSHAWERAKELDKLDLYQGIKDELVKQMREKNA